MLNNTFYNGKNPPKYFINGKQVQSMYYNNSLVYHLIDCKSLTLNAGEIILTKNKTFTLTAKVTPADCTEEVVFTSSNTSVATVNKGVITAVNLGTCNIVVTCGDVSAICKVSVKEETLYLYNRGVINNDSEFGKIIHPTGSQFVYQSDNIFLTLAGSGSKYGTIWFSWANQVDLNEFDIIHMDITNTTDHSTIIGLTRNNVTGQQGYMNGNPTPVDGDTFVDDRTVVTLLQGVNKHSLDIDLVAGTGYMGLYFKRDTTSGDSLEEFININTIYLVRKSVYIVGTGEDASPEVKVPCTGLEFIKDEIELEYTGANTMHNMNTYLNRSPQNCDEPIIWEMIDDGDHVMDVNANGYLVINGVGSCNIQAICGKYFDNIRVNTKVTCTSVSLSKSSVTLDLSGTVTTTVSATKVPADSTSDIVFASSNNDIATVTQFGVITARGNGTCNITATCGDKTATCAVTVKSSCTSVILSKSSYTLDLSGTDSVTFTPTIAPSNTTDSITWKSSNTGVATVTATSGGTKGTIFAKAPGTSTVTVTCGTKSASVTITVERSCTGLSISKTSHTMNLYKYQNSTGADNDVVLTATKTPSNSTDVITWKSNSTSVATVSNGTVKAVGPGTATITATCGSKTASCTVTIIAVSFNVDVASYVIVQGKTTTVDLSSNLVVIPSNYKSSAVWRSNDTSIASITQSGVMTLKGAGIATIYANVNGIEVSQLIMVDAVKQPGISLSANDSYMIPGERHTFYADISNYHSSYNYKFEVGVSKNSISVVEAVMVEPNRLAVSIVMNTAEAAAVNLTLTCADFAPVTARFEVYVRV